MRTCLGDNSLLAEAHRQHSLCDAVVDLVGASVVEILSTLCATRRHMSSTITSFHLFTCTLTQPWVGNSRPALTFSTRFVLRLPFQSGALHSTTETDGRRSVCVCSSKATTPTCRTTSTSTAISWADAILPQTISGFDARRKLHTMYIKIHEIEVLLKSLPQQWSYLASERTSAQ